MFVLLELKPFVRFKWKVLGEKFWKSAKKCEKVWKSVKNYETILPFSCCPLVFPWINKQVCDACNWNVPEWNPEQIRKHPGNALRANSEFPDFRFVAAWDPQTLDYKADSLPRLPWTRQVSQYQFQKCRPSCWIWDLHMNLLQKIIGAERLFEFRYPAQHFPKSECIELTYFLKFPSGGALTYASFGQGFVLCATLLSADNGRVIGRS